MHYKVWGEITHPFPNFNGAISEVCEWISNFTSHFSGHVITYPCWDKMLIRVNKMRCWLCVQSISSMSSKTLETWKCTLSISSRKSSSWTFFSRKSSNGNIFRFTGPLWGESTDHQWIPSQRPEMWGLGDFFDLHLNERLSNQSRRRWFEMPSG